MKLTSKLILIIGALAVMLQASHSSGSSNTKSTEGDAALWSFDTPVDGGVYNVHAGYAGGGPEAGTATLTVYQHVNTNPNGVYPSELVLISASLASTHGGSFWVDDGGAESGSLFATITPNPGFETISPFGDETSVLPPELGSPEENAQTIVQLMGGDSVAFYVGPGSGN